MASRNNGRHSQNSRRVPSGEIDRYNYVERDIYSNSRDIYSSSGRGTSPRRPPNKKKKRKNGRGKRILITFLVLIALVAVLGIVLGAMMLQRIERDNTDPTSYVQQPSDAPAWEVMEDDKVTNILLLGADRMEDGLQRSDTMMLVSMDNKNQKLKLVSFLRDLYVEIPTIGKDKLNASFSNGGPILTMQTIENNFRVNIDRYVMVDVDGFATIIDKMGGIEVVVNQAEADEMNRVKGCTLSAGKNHMRGTLALYYARMRRIDSDFGRTGRQRQVIGCMIDKMKSLNPLEVTSVMYDYLEAGNVKTNLTDGELLYLASIALKVADYPMETMHIPETGAYEDRTLENGSQVLYPYLEQNCALLREFLYGAEES